MSVSTLNVDYEYRQEGSYITVHTPEGPVTVGPFNPFQDHCLHGVKPAAMKSMPPITSKSAKTQRRRAMRQEDEIASRYEGGRRVRGSGSVKGNKGDVRVHGLFRIEAKYTQHDSYRITLELLRKLRGEAAGLELPMFEIHFLDECRQARERWVLFDARYLHFMKYEPPYATTVHS